MDPADFLDIATKMRRRWGRDENGSSDGVTEALSDYDVHESCRVYYDFVVTVCI